MRKLIINIIGILIFNGTTGISHAGITIDASNYQNNIMITGGQLTRGDVNGKILISSYAVSTWSTHMRLWFLPALTEGGRFINYVLPYKETPDCPSELINASSIEQKDELFIRWANEYINSNPIIPFSNRVGDFKKPIERTVLHDFITLTCVFNHKTKSVMFADFKHTRIVNPPEGNPPEEPECVPGVVTPIVPRVVDFGMLDQRMLAQGVSGQFAFRIQDDTQTLGCEHQLQPIITFNSAEKVIDDEIYLSNGTILSLYNHNPSDPDSRGKIPLGVPIKALTPASSSLYITLLEAKLRSNPNQPLISGPFSTTVVYKIEYR